MKKEWIVIMLVILFLGVSTASFAEEGMDMDMNKQGGMMQQGGGMMRQGMMGKGMMGMGQGMCPMCSSMMKSMSAAQLVSTGDGGFVILMGNKLTKYDKNLNVVKEVELKVDQEGMMKMIKDCPMCKMMKEKKGEKKEMKMEHQ